MNLLLQFGTELSEQEPFKNIHRSILIVGLYNYLFLFSIFTGKFDYFKEQDKLHKLREIAVSDKEYIVSSSVNSWYEEFIQWAIDKKPGKYIKESKFQKLYHKNIFL